MSLIIDALRRADSERERGSVPGLHTQPVPPPSVETPPQSRARPWHWMLIGVALGLLVALAWYIVGREAPRQVIESAGAVRPVTPVASRAPDAVRAPVMSAPQAVSPAEMQPVAEPAPWPSNENRKAPAPVRSDAKSEQPTKSSPAEAPIYSREQLPENIRAQLPALTFGGSMYSTNAANRSLVINGQLYRENEQLTADLSLEQIKLKAAVLRFKGYRFEIQF